jgi:hypothetical protein
MEKHVLRIAQQWIDSATSCHSEEEYLCLARKVLHLIPLNHLVLTELNLIDAIMMLQDYSCEVDGLPLIPVQIRHLDKLDLIRLLLQQNKGLCKKAEKLIDFCAKLGLKQDTWILTIQIEVISALLRESEWFIAVESCLQWNAGLIDDQSAGVMYEVCEKCYERYPEQCESIIAMAIRHAGPKLVDKMVQLKRQMSMAIESNHLCDQVFGGESSEGLLLEEKLQMLHDATLAKYEPLPAIGSTPMTTTPITDYMMLQEPSDSQLIKAAAEQFSHFPCLSLVLLLHSQEVILLNWLII